MEWGPFYTLGWTCDHDFLQIPMPSAYFSCSATVRQGEQTAVQHGDRQISFAELDARSDRLASRLLGLGLTEGDRVAVQMPMCLELAEVEYALLKAGLVKVGISPHATPEEAGRKVESGNARAFIVGADYCGYTAATPAFASVTVFISIGKSVEGYVAYDDLIRQNAPPLLVSKTCKDTVVGSAPCEHNRIALVGPITQAAAAIMHPHLAAASTLVLFDNIESAGFLRAGGTDGITHVLLEADSLRQLINRNAHPEPEKYRPHEPDALLRRIVEDTLRKAGSTSDDGDCAAAEAALHTHPSVMEACAIKVPDEAGQESLKAVVALRPGTYASASELIAHCCANNAEHQCPASVDFVAELPKNASGNLARKLVREQYRQAYRLPR